MLRTFFTLLGCAWIVFLFTLNLGSTTSTLVTIIGSALLLWVLSSTAPRLCKKYAPALTKPLPIQPSLLIVGLSVYVSILILQIVINKYGLTPVSLHLFGSTLITFAKQTLLGTLLCVSFISLGLRLIPQKLFSDLKTPLITLATSFGLGVMFCMVFFSLLGFAGLLYPSIAWILLITSLVFGYTQTIALFRELSTPITIPACTSRTNVWIATSLLATLSTFAYLIINTLTQHPISQDALRLYMSLPKLYIEKHEIVTYTAHVFDGFPKYAEMIFTQTLLIGNHITVNVILLFFVLTTAIFIYGIYTTLSKRPSQHPLFILSFFSTPSILWLSMGAQKIDLILLFFTTGSIFFLVQYQQSKQNTHFILFAIFTGIMAGIKYTSIIFIITSWIALIFILKDPKKILKQTTLLVGIMCILFAPWGIRNTINHGNPFAPLFYNTIHTKDSFYETVGMEAFSYVSNIHKGESYTELFDYEDRPLSFYPLLPLNITAKNVYLKIGYSDIGILFLGFIFLLFRKTSSPQPVKKTLLIYVLIPFIALYTVIDTVIWYILPMFVPLLVLYQASLDTLTEKTKTYFTFILTLNIVLVSISFGHTSGFTVLDNQFDSTNNTLGHYSTTRFEDLRNISEYINSLSLKKLKVYYPNDNAVYWIDNFHSIVIPNYHMEIFGYYHNIQKLTGQEITQALQKLDIMYILVNTQDLKNDAQLNRHVREIQAPDYSKKQIQTMEDFTEYASEHLTVVQAHTHYTLYTYNK